MSNNSFTKIDDLIQRVALEAKDVEMVTVCSNYFFPEIVSFRSKEYLIWDEHYWMLFQNYLTHYYLLNAIRKEGADASLINNCKNVIMGDMYYFLSLKLSEYPHISYVLAKECRRLSSKHFSVAVNTDSYSDFLNIILRYSKHFCLTHELQHIENKLRPDEFFKCLDRFKYIIGKIKEYIGDDRDFYSPGRIDHVPESLIDGAMTMIDQGHVFLEEIICDYVATVETSKSFRHLIRGATNSDLYQFSVLGLNTMQSFQGQLSGMYAWWKTACQFYCKEISGYGFDKNSYDKINTERQNMSALRYALSGIVNNFLIKFVYLKEHNEIFSENKLLVDMEDTYFIYIHKIFGLEIDKSAVRILEEANSISQKYTESELIKMRNSLLELTVL
ncbi:MAG: hypothetical protein LBE81_00990 [Azonexus sp.]|jgi:hypothetical protein|uniref:hypothetical protein n=1 Tax=Azonexus sp. TaxID=1872668 RepID=UPI00281A974D|nr:hypothetical protein [Azonexus sp.]MDR0775203.1 hypothetical protein [Azonexus sp.]